jgi:hypothetical protein
MFAWYAGPADFGAATNISRPQLQRQAPIENPDPNILIPQSSRMLTSIARKSIVKAIPSSQSIRRPSALLKIHYPAINGQTTNNSFTTFTSKKMADMKKIHTEKAFPGIYSFPQSAIGGLSVR